MSLVAADVLVNTNRVTGFPNSAREAHLKRVRALQGSGWQTDPARFEALAQATVALSAATLGSLQSGSSSQRCAFVFTLRLLVCAELKHVQQTCIITTVSFVLSMVCFIPEAVHNALLIYNKYVACTAKG